MWTHYWYAKLFGVFLAIGSSILAFLLWRVRIRRTRARLAAIAAGTLCIACESSDVIKDGTGVRCTRCGYVTSAALRGAPVSEAEIALLSEPDRRRENGLFPPK